MKVYKVELLIVDHDNCGPADITASLENARYPNRCIDPIVMDIDGRDIGQWSDDNPLNKYDTMKAEFQRLFTVA